MKRLLFAALILFFAEGFAQKPITTIPFELYGDHIIMPVSVDGSAPLDFIFDSGSGLTVLDIDVAKDLGLDLENWHAEMGAEGQITSSVIKHNRLEINDFLMEKNIKVYATDLGHLEISIGKGIDGIVGYDLLIHHGIKINYDKSVIEIYEQGKVPKSGKAIPFKLVIAAPTIEAKVVLNNDEKLAGVYFVNTGAGTSMDFNTPFAKKNDVIHKTGEHYKYLVKGVTSVEAFHYEGRVKSFKVGDAEFSNLPIGISLSDYGLQGDATVAGIIGNKLLSKFNITFDYAAKIMYLEKNRLFDKKISVSCSGIDVQLAKDKKSVLIHRVFEGSPAEMAGIRVNDLLLKIGGKDAMEFTLHQIEDILKKEGETVELTVLQGGAEKAVSLTLKALL